MRVNLSVKKAIYRDLQIISEAMKKPIPTICRECIESEAFTSYLHNLAVMIESKKISPSDVAIPSKYNKTNH